MRCVFGFLGVAALVLAGCGESQPADDSPYASKDLWMCRPDIENDYCDQADLSVTEIQPDGRYVVSDVPNNSEANVDCFFVYGTCDLSETAGNSETLVPPSPCLQETVQQNAASYRGVCRVFVPLYHQMTIGTYFEHRFIFQDTEFFQRALGDVSEAFAYYMRHYNNGRDFVLIGQSQGSHILAKFLEEEVDNNDELRGRLLSAILTGTGGTVQVPKGELVGGTYVNIPLCASASSTGCVVAFDAIAAKVESQLEATVIVYPPNVSACVNPASFDHNQGKLAGLLYPRSFGPVMLPFPDDVGTEWVRYPSIYTSQCSDRGGLRDTLLIDLSSEYTGQVPFTLQELQQELVEDWKWYTLGNLHIVEPFLAITDLVHMVEQQTASRDN
jgi:hypothetical protein